MNRARLGGTGHPAFRWVALAGLLLTGCASQGQPGALTPLRTPRLFSSRAELLRTSAERLLTGADHAALQRLIRSADSALTAGPFTVTAKQALPPSGDRRDYMSMAPYWWPDSTRPGGVPFIRRDGEFNMATRRDSDVLRWYAMTDAVETLARAWYFTGRSRYAERAVLLLRTWFLDATTRMNPHLRYGQAIPGVTEGRGIGIIDTRDLDRLTDAIALLEGSVAWTQKDAEGVRAWMAAYLGWLRTSEHGREEADQPNNHGTWYDVQVVALALFLGDSALARTVAEQSRVRRIAAQVDSMGGQPLELARTRSLHYSMENLDGMTRLAEMARHVGVDLWSWQSPGGASLRRAIDFVAPYADPGRKWPAPQITEEPPDMFVLLLRRASVALGDHRYARLLDALPAEVRRGHIADLLYPEMARSGR